MRPLLLEALIFSPVLLLVPLWLYLRWEKRRHADSTRIQLPNTDLL